MPYPKHPVYSNTYYLDLSPDAHLLLQPYTHCDNVIIVVYTIVTSPSTIMSISPTVSHLDAATLL